MKKLSLLFTFLVATLFAMAQDVTVSGTVTNSAGKGIEGINVLVKGTSKGTVTKADGTFTLMLLQMVHWYSVVSALDSRK